MPINSEVQSEQQAGWRTPSKGAIIATTHAFPEPHQPRDYLFSKLSEDSGSMLWIWGHETKPREVVRCRSENRDSVKMDVLDSTVPQSSNFLAPRGTGVRLEHPSLKLTRPQKKDQQYHYSSPPPLEEWAPM